MAFDQITFSTFLKSFCRLHMALRDTKVIYLLRLTGTTVLAGLLRAKSMPASVKSIYIKVERIT